MGARNRTEYMRKWRAENVEKVRSYNRKQRKKLKAAGHQHEMDRRRSAFQALGLCPLCGAERQRYSKCLKCRLRTAKRMKELRAKRREESSPANV